MEFQLGLKFIGFIPTRLDFWDTNLTHLQQKCNVGKSFLGLSIPATLGVHVSWHGFDTHAVLLSVVAAVVLKNIITLCCSILAVSVELHPERNGVWDLPLGLYV